MSREWQARWDTATWTWRLIKDVDMGRWAFTFHLTQVLSGHGCFASYLYRFNLLQSPRYWFCDSDDDDVKHSIFVCNAWETRRSKISWFSGVEFTSESMVKKMLRSMEAWNVISYFIHEVLKTKEEEERRRQRLRN